MCVFDPPGAKRGSPPGLLRSLAGSQIFNAMDEHGCTSMHACGMHMCSGGGRQNTTSSRGRWVQRRHTTNACITIDRATFTERSMCGVDMRMEVQAAQRRIGGRMISATTHFRFAAPCMPNHPSLIGSSLCHTQTHIPNQTIHCRLTHPRPSHSNPLHSSPTGVIRFEPTRWTPPVR